MYVLGDTHGIKPIFNIVDSKKLQDCNIIHVGDVGLGFQEIRRDVSDLLILDEMCIENNIKLYLLRGNHDNPIFWDKSKGLNLPKFHNIYLVDDYTVILIEGKNVLFIGGALSIDRRPRMTDYPYPSWWKDEEFFYDEKRLKSAINNHKNIDIVVTHTAPDFCYPTSDNVPIVNDYHNLEMQYGVNLKEELKMERYTVTRMFNDLTKKYKKEPTDWFYGHFHNKKSQFINNVNFHLLNINEVYELK